jgi:tetratricopeptide (TPR) repeat protein/2-polyprenyl-3-methyl-5-hydroxy-6-metoxy-1,4-benzoquinol methylase
MSRQQRRGFGPPGAKPAFGIAASAANSPAALFNAAVAHHQTGALIEAERQYRHILTLVPNHADSLHNLGLITLQRGDAAAAVALFDKAIQINNTVAEYHYNIALAWRALKRNDHVATHLERAVALRADHALAHLNLGNVRREQGRLSEAIACYERALALSPNSPEARFNLANMLSEQHCVDAAVANYRQVLALIPNHPEALAGLGAARLTQGQPREATGFIERALALKPNLPGAVEQLATAYFSAGDVQSALLAAADAVESSETESSKTLFAQCAAFANFTSDRNARFTKLMRRALEEAWTIPRDISRTCISLIKLDPRIGEMIARADRLWPERLAAKEIIEESRIAPLAEDQLLGSVLKCDQITDLGLERLIANVRRALLYAVTAEDAKDDEVKRYPLDFCCAVARQCFNNQYVFSMTENESARAKTLRDSVDAALGAGAAPSPLHVALVGAYQPLYELSNAERLLGKSWPHAVNALLVQQIEEPAEERRIKAALSALTAIDDEVSLAVRSQYEENPYPRWIKSGPPIQPTILARRPAAVADVLIAGCGTGAFGLAFARKVPEARFLAVDLSLSSLGYAKRMADSLGLKNVEFAQADIMKLGSLGRTFDFIDSSGVLHHMADPWAGWRVLLSLLRPDGAMQLGFYSELARQNIVAARALIAEQGYRPVPDDIRRIRETIAAAEDGSLLKSITQWGDFFSMSECRDLLLHTQEHRTSLPEIKRFLAANDLRFAGFMIDALTADRFARRYPELTNLAEKARFDAFADLDLWHAFETEHPETFVAMYRFWVHKSGARS